jgi:hypothetical protein
MTAFAFGGGRISGLILEVRYQSVCSPTRSHGKLSEYALMMTLTGCQCL